MRGHLIAGMGGALLLLAGAPAPAPAQTLGPIRGVVTSMSDRFALRLLAVNHADAADRYTIRVFNPDFTEIADAQVSARQVAVRGNGSTPVIVVVPFLPGEAEREVLVCSETAPAMTAQFGFIRGQICGRYFGRRWR